MPGSRISSRRALIPAVACALVVTALLGTPATAAPVSSDPGINSPEALKNPDCDATRKQIKFPAITAPACV